jgi:Domain of unknown function (DUF4259)
MGAWGAGAFDNDDALDWVGALEERGDAAIRDALAAVAAAGEDDDVESGAAAEALAASEVVAALSGHAADGVPEAARAWVEGRGVPPHDLVELALRAAARVERSSELRELWEEAGADDWVSAVRDLRFRLGDAAAP